MGNALENLGIMLGQVVQRMSYLKGVNLIYGKYKANDKMDGVDENMNKLVLGEPSLDFDMRDMSGLPIHLYFSIAGDTIKMQYEFNVNTKKSVLDKVPNATPMLMTDLSLYMHIKNDGGKETTERLNYNMLSLRPQVARGERKWSAIDEFVEIKKAFEEGRVNFTWSAKVQWVDVSSKEIQEKLKNPDYVPEPQVANVNDTINIGEILPGSCTHASMFDGVKHLLRWEAETVEGNKVYFMDPFKDDALYFLPQEFRIRALPNNAPDMTTEIVSENGGYKVLMRFGIAPYVHPKAKRDLYRIFNSRKKKEYCEIRYGGYTNAYFDRSNSELADGTLYGKDGFELVTDDKEIKATPESCFCIVLKAPTDGLVKLFQENIMSDSDELIHIGDVYFNVSEGLEQTSRQLGPIPVTLNLHKLAGVRPRVSIVECKWPNYIAQITNTGLYPIQIGGAALSVLRRDGNQIKDVKHELKSNTVWPQSLAKGESLVVQLSDEQVEKIKHRRIPLFWKIKEDYWTEFICEPYHIRLPDESLEEIMEKNNESAAYEYEKWELTLISNFNWCDYPDMTAVQVEIKNRFGLNEIVTLTEDGERPKISMAPNLNVEQKTQQAGDKVFEYRVRAVVKNSPKKPEWSEWMSDSGSSLFIYGEDISSTEK